MGRNKTQVFGQCDACGIPADFVEYDDEDAPAMPAGWVLITVTRMVLDEDKTGQAREQARDAIEKQVATQGIALTPEQHTGAVEVYAQAILAALDDLAYPETTEYLLCPEHAALLDRAVQVIQGAE